MAAYSAAVSLNQLIRGFLKYVDVLLPPVGLEAYRFASKELNSFQMFAEGLDSRSRKRMKASLARIAVTISESDVLVSRSEIVIPNYEEWEEISTRIDSLVEEMNKVKEEYYRLAKEEEAVSSSRVVSKSKIVGLRDKRRNFKESIINPWHQYPVLSVSGMAGIGKTALVRELFEDLDISECFDCRAWVTVGCDWKSKEITKAILAQVDHEGHNNMAMSKRLKECLKGKRYLIVLDDVWNDRVHVYRKVMFPDNLNGSRVIVTSRLNSVAADVKENCYRLSTQLLNKEESWDLLRETVFVGDSCPPYLEDAGKKIAEKCDGLPLTILAVADLLSKAEESLWIDAAMKKKHQLFTDAYAQISQVLYPSYKVLYDEDKLCLLYMSAFPLKYEIPKSRLVNLWIVEELIEQRLDKTLETFALDILGGLDCCNLVMVYQRAINSFLGSNSSQIKTCGLHSSWWHFCQMEARNTSFFHVLDSYNKDSLEKTIEGHNRLSFHTKVLFAIKHVHNSIEEICASSAHSLLCFGPYSQYMVPVCFGLKFLLRLDALNIRFYDFPLDVLELVMLKYLALTCNRNLPSTISLLKKLQYLIVQPHSSIKSGAVLSNLPVETWDMKRLKHLQVVGRDLPDLGDTSLEKLLTLSGVTTGSCTVLNRVPNITKLGIKIELTPDAAEPLCFFDHVSHLTKLESLTCVIVNPERKYEVVAPFPCLPHSLTKLNLNGLGYPWEEMSKIASLPNLEVLKLRYNAFQGPEWGVENNGFPKLRTLQIEDMDLVKLRWAPGSFKSLKVLRIKHCYKLEELHLGHSQDMFEIEVVDCNHWVEWEEEKLKINLHNPAGSGFMCCVQPAQKMVAVLRNSGMIQGERIVRGEVVNVDVGVDAGEYARELMRNSVKAIKEVPHADIDPLQVLEKAYGTTNAMGSSTACIIALKNQVFEIPVAPGDVIVAGTDGLFDNLYSNEIASLVSDAAEEGLCPDDTAEKIAGFARARALDRKYESPFSKAAQEAGFTYYGGKLDDLTVVVSSVSAQPASNFGLSHVVCCEWF